MNKTFAAERILVYVFWHLNAESIRSSIKYLLLFMFKNSKYFLHRVFITRGGNYQLLVFVCITLDGIFFCRKMNKIFQNFFLNEYPNKIDVASSLYKPILYLSIFTSNVISAILFTFHKIL